MRFLICRPKAEKILALTFEEMLAYSARDKKEAAISVGIIRGGETSYTVYGNNGGLRPALEHVYEIASLTKTFTAALLSKALREGRVSLAVPIDEYLDLPEQEHYPTLGRLVSHTAGYKNFYLEKQIIFNLLRLRRNGFYGLGVDTLLRRVGKTRLENREYGFRYSGFGMSVVGAVLAKVYQENFACLMNGFIKNDLQLPNTKIGDGSGDLAGYWQWQATDAFLPAGALTSTISDLLQYLRLHMTEALPYPAGSRELLDRVPAVGLGWMMDAKENLFYHSGGTSHFSSFAAFNPREQFGVAVLANFSPYHKVSAAVLGRRLLSGLDS